MHSKERYEPMKSKYLFFSLLTTIMLVAISNSAAELPSYALFPVKVQEKWGFGRKRASK